jgi:hypothetical protein
MRRPGSVWLLALQALAFVALWLTPAEAQAYPWMIRHHYTGCSACHFDPSGAGALTPYGRVIADTVLRTRTDAEPDELSPASGFLFGAVRTPAWLELGGDLRVMALSSKSSDVPRTDRTIWMQLDGEATIDVGGFVASGTLGYAPEGALGAAITRGPEHNLVSRQHWLGYRTSSGQLWVRAGRLNLPFGIRAVEHTLDVRQLTRTNINDQQQYGVAAALLLEKVRGELMAIGGNLQLRPDDYRERGYSGYFEWAVLDSLALGASSLVTYRARDTVTLKETWRHAHGGFARVVPGWDPLVLQAEWDWVLSSSKDEFHRKGFLGYLQADLECQQGMHVILTGETSKVGARPRYRSWGGWLSYVWFLAPHVDLRLDFIQQSMGSSIGRFGVTTLLVQAHASL